MPKLIKAAGLGLPVFTVLFLSSIIGVRVEAHPSPADRLVRDAKLEKIAARLSGALDMSKPIQVVIVPENDRVVSVEPFISGQGYRIEIERDFFEQLNDEEVVAALAHEIGHVWIFSHPPYLQTESLANEIALRVIPRKTMETLYAKLWKYIGVEGDLAETLGDENAATASVSSER